MGSVLKVENTGFRAVVSPVIVDGKGSETVKFAISVSRNDFQNLELPTQRP